MMIGEDEKRYLTALASIPDVGPLTVKKLLAAFGSAQAVFGADAKKLAAAGIGPRRVEAISKFSDWRGFDLMLERAGKAGIRVVALGEDDYPRMLALIPDCPPVLYVKGQTGEEDRFALGIVGTRTPTAYGVSQAEGLAAGLAKKGFTIVSGLARGIDTAAHEGALKAGGRSIAVMGSGLDVPYPPENAGLIHRLAASGAVISEFPPGTAPNKENFPRRNRLISALSLGILVVEAGKGSGSLITARCALEQGKEVFAIPGNISSAFSRGTNELIKQGARVVTGVDDMIEELAPVLKGLLFLNDGGEEQGKASPQPKPEASQPAVPFEQLSEEEKLVVGALGTGPKHIDEIARDIGFDAPRIMGVLLSLELSGVVRQSAGKKFSIC